MKLYKAAEMRRADLAAADAGVPTQLLMEVAGRAVADSALLHFPSCRRPLVLCGKGNNGGDGYVAARYLHIAGRQVAVLELTGEPKAGDAAAARSACRAHIATYPLDKDSLRRVLGQSDLVIDALFGSGLQRPLEGQLAEIVGLVNESSLPVLAVDVPSGVSSDHPVPPGVHTRATRTVQLAGAKLSSAFEPARAAYGEQEVVDIGIPRQLLERSSTTRLLGEEAAVRGIPQRTRDAHKYQVGTVLVLAGSPRYLGAAELACRGAYRAGAGLVTLAAEARAPSSWPEIVFTQLGWDAHPLAALDDIDEKRAGAVVAGPGLDERALDHLPSLLARRPVPWVLDAGALADSEQLRAAVRSHGRCVLTPHAGEAARLLATGGASVNSRPLMAASRIASDWNAICVLKGGSTMIAAPDGSVAVSTGGHEGMATGGTGDVLAGILGAFLAVEAPAAGIATGGMTPAHGQGAGDEKVNGLLERIEAAVAVHALAGGRAGRRLGVGMVASDLVEAIPAVLADLANRSP